MATDIPVSWTGKAGQPRVMAAVQTLCMGTIAISSEKNSKGNVWSWKENVGKPEFFLIINLTKYNFNKTLIVQWTYLRVV